MEERLRWHSGQVVEWRNVAPYSIAHLVGEAGNIHIAETGRFHVYWHRELNGIRVLVHHGGEQGFATLQKAKHQHERVIAGYSGINIDISPEEMEEGVVPDRNLAQLTQQMSLEIPGEQQLVGGWISVIQRATRDLTTARSAGKISFIRESLGELLQDRLGRSVNRYKRSAAEALQQGLAGTRPELLSGLTEAQLQLLLRTQEVLAITVGTMKRYNALEILEVSWNDIVVHLPEKYARAVKVLGDSTAIEARRTTVVNDLIHPQTGIRTRLAELKGEPYLSRASEFLEALDPIEQLWQERELPRLLIKLTQQAQEAQVWKDRVRNATEGPIFGRFALA